tara:strand:- start:9772 stop:10302 length:531 start_codon:yes stop_codon:yes gene_type:complete
MNQQGLITKIKQGKIFIYPTDTVYGIGCNAEDKKAVDKIKEIKLRDKDKPLSIIAPSIDWIKENCITNNIEFSKYFPGPYTIILEKKNPNFLQHISNTNTLGIRIPKSDFCFKIQKSNLPFITTSVNKSGEKPATRISDINKEIINKVDEVIEIEDESKLSGKPSTLIINNKEIKR